jgi:hypothetical protein
MYTFYKACKSRSNRHWVFLWYSEVVVHMRVMIYLHQPLLGSSLTGREDTKTGWVPRVCYITHGCVVWLKYPFSMSQVACILWYTGWTENTRHSVTTSEKNPSIVEGWGIFSNKAFYSWCVRALGQGVFYGRSLEAGILFVICTFQTGHPWLLHWVRHLCQGIMLWTLASALGSYSMMPW